MTATIRPTHSLAAGGQALREPRIPNVASRGWVIAQQNSLSGARRPGQDPQPAGFALARRGMRSGRIRRAIGDTLQVVG